MKTKLDTIDSETLSTATGGLNLGSMVKSVQQAFPPLGPTIPLGPFTPPSTTDTVSTKWPTPTNGPIH